MKMKSLCSKRFKERGEEENNISVEKLYSHIFLAELHFHDLAFASLTVKALTGQEHRH